MYPELAKLADAGFVRFSPVQQARRPDKKVYSLNETGAEALKTWVRLPPKPAPDRRELTVKAHAVWLIDRADAAAMFQDQVERTETEITEIETHRDMLSTQSEGPFPPPADDPLFGTYANTTYALDSRRQLVEWCEWVAERFESAAGTARIRA
jgi:DNA-binding PadR family transcriptional regulator